MHPLAASLYAHPYAQQIWRTPAPGSV
jgi:hypothetical protein